MNLDFSGLENAYRKFKEDVIPEAEEASKMIQAITTNFRRLGVEDGVCVKFSGENSFSSIHWKGGKLIYLENDVADEIILSGAKAEIRALVKSHLPKIIVAAEKAIQDRTKPLKSGYDMANALPNIP